MSGIEEIVKINITRETLGEKRKGFSVPIIVGTCLNTGARIGFFTDRQAVADAVIGGTSSVEYAMADVIFSQNPRIDRLAIGGAFGDRAVVFTGTMTQGTLTVVVNGTTVVTPFDTDLETTVVNLGADIDGLGITGVDSAVGLNGKVEVFATDGSPLGLYGASADGLAVSDSVDVGDVKYGIPAVPETLTETLEAIKLTDNSWYGVLITSIVQSEQIELAEWTEDNEKVCAVRTSEENIVDKSAPSDTTTIAYLFKEAGYTRSVLCFIKDNLTDYPDAGIFGRLLPLDAGTYTAKFKTLIGVTVDNFTSTQSLNARDKNCNTYEEIGGRNIFSEGITPSGEFLDVIIFIDWLKARMSEDVYFTLAKADKIPYTDKGIQTVKNSMERSLKTGLNRGGISDFVYDENKVQKGGYVIQVPALIDTDQTDRANRLLRDVKFTAWLAGAIHRVIIDGTITI